MEALRTYLNLTWAKKKKASSSTPKLTTSTDSNGCSTPENLLAFSTITTMLSLIPRGQPIAVVDKIEDKAIPSATDRQELRILDAFAHLAVGEHDVAAMVSDHRIQDGELGIRFCANSVAIDDNISTHMQSRSWPTIVQETLTYVFTRNVDKNDPLSNSETALPTITLPKKPWDLGNRTAMNYMIDLVQNW